MNAMHETDETTSMKTQSPWPTVTDDASATRSVPHGDAAPTAGPVLLSWTDPEEGETLWVEMWATPEFVDDLLAQGFAVRPVAEDESASSLFVRILHRGADEA